MDTVGYFRLLIIARSWVLLAFVAANSFFITKCWRTFSLFVAIADHLLLCFTGASTGKAKLNAQCRWSLLANTLLVLQEHCWDRRVVLPPPPLCPSLILIHPCHKYELKQLQPRMHSPRVSVETVSAVRGVYRQQVWKDELAVAVDMVEEAPCDPSDFSW